MLSYNLAKKLKDAGFPQKGFWFYGSNETDTPCLTYETNLYDTCGITFKRAVGDNDITGFPYYSEKIKLCYAPTLSELIEACGERFFGVWRYRDGNYWKAEAHNEMFEDLVVTNTYQTPEEAVAELWLKLNERKTD